MGFVINEALNKLGEITSYDVDRKNTFCCKQYIVWHKESVNFNSILKMWFFNMFLLNSQNDKMLASRIVHTLHWYRLEGNVRLHFSQNPLWSLLVFCSVYFYHISNENTFLLINAFKTSITFPVFLKKIGKFWKLAFLDTKCYENFSASEAS